MVHPTALAMARCATRRAPPRRHAGIDSGARSTATRASYGRCDARGVGDARGGTGGRGTLVPTSGAISAESTLAMSGGTTTFCNSSRTPLGTPREPLEHPSSVPGHCAAVHRAGPVACQQSLRVGFPAAGGHSLRVGFPLLAGTLCEWDSRCWRALSASGSPAAGRHSLRVGFWRAVTCG